GAQEVGDPRGFHGVALDGRAPKFDGGIVTRLDSVPFGVAVNKHGERFYDEGEDFWPKRYAIWGGLIARQPDQIAYSIFDSRMLMKNGVAMENLYAAGEIMSGNILSSGYLAGFGLTIGTVFGRIAGREAATHGRH